ncbi:MAG TPA: hypothetical protein DDY20_10385 [Desulfobulbaceae bacterium]|nr:hypothetical protein [Desulfobulbaceae bacterium]
MNVTVGLALLALLYASTLQAADKVVVIPMGSGAKGTVEPVAQGTNGQVQYNDEGKMAGAEVYYDKATGKLELPGEIRTTVATGSATSGTSTGGFGIYGLTENGYGVYGVDTGATQGRGYGGYFTSNTGVGVFGYSNATNTWTNMYAPGIYGKSANGTGVFGRSDSTQSWRTAGVLGWGTGGPGGLFLSYSGNIIEGYEDVNLNNDNVLYLRFKVDYNGNVYADGTYSSPAADVAERIDPSERLEPGSVVEIDPDSPGRFRLSRSPFSTLVAGVISTNPAVIMNNGEIENSDRPDDRPLLALTGQVPVRVSAENGPIVPGDMLVSSSAPGHAMRAGGDPPAGTVVGKALGVLDSGTGLIQVLATLQ